jgi:hypothetical protein
MTTSLVTGANSGLGFEVAPQLVVAGHQVWIGAVGAPERARRDTSRSSSPRRTPVAKRAGRPPGASSAVGQRTEANRRRGRRARRSTTPSARGALPTMRCSSASPRSTSRCSLPTATSDPMILPGYSYLLAGLLPDARSRSTRTRPTALPTPQPVRRRRERVTGRGRVMPRAGRSGWCRSRLELAGRLEAFR